MIRVPEAASFGMQSQFTAQRFPFVCGDHLEPAVELDGIEAAENTDAPVAPQDPLPKIPRIRAQSPLVNAVIVAESPPARRHLLMAPAADAPAVRASLFCAPNPAAGGFSVCGNFSPQSGGGRVEKSFTAERREEKPFTAEPRRARRNTERKENASTEKALKTADKEHRWKRRINKDGSKQERFFARCLCG